MTFFKHCSLFTNKLRLETVIYLSCFVHLRAINLKKTFVHYLKSVSSLPLVQIIQNRWYKYPWNFSCVYLKSIKRGDARLGNKVRLKTIALVLEMPINASLQCVYFSLFKPIIRTQEWVKRSHFAMNFVVIQHTVRIKCLYIFYNR